MTSTETGPPDAPATRRQGWVAREELRWAGISSLVALGLLNVADVALTRLLLHRGEVELNPLAEHLLATNTTVLVKLSIVLLLAARLLRRGPDLVTVCLLWMVTGIYVCVVIVNGATLLST